MTGGLLFLTALFVVIFVLATKLRSRATTMVQEDQQTRASRDEVHENGHDEPLSAYACLFAAFFVGEVRVLTGFNKNIELYHLPATARSGHLKGVAAASARWPLVKRICGRRAPQIAVQPGISIFLLNPL